ncbi:DNA polymerase IV [Gordonia jinhuaensis]
MDAFFASVEQLTKPTLRGRPVLVGGTGGRGVVAGASYEARVFGARSAMPMHQARRLVGVGAVVVPPRGEVYHVVSRRVFGVIRSFVPVLETLSFDEAFAEPEVLHGAGREEAIAFAEELREAVRRDTGLAASVGLGGGKQIAKIASGMAKPDGVVAVDPGTDRSFLAPLPVRKLWGIGPVAGDRLQRLGIETIGQLAALSDPEVASVLGATVGPALHQLANGIDNRPVAERAQAKQISAESTFADDLTTMAQLHPAIVAAASSAHRRLLADGRAARTVVLKLKKSDMSVLTRSATLAAATIELPVLTAAAARLALDPLDIGPVRLVGVGFTGLSADQQLDLFAPVGDVDARAAERAGVGSGADASDAGSGKPDDSGKPGDSGKPDDSGQRGEHGYRDDSARVDLSSVQKGDPRTDALRAGRDVRHPEFGHGWVQGSGHGVVTVRFETRLTGPGPVRTFPVGTSELTVADPLASLDWPPEHLRPDDEDGAREETGEVESTEGRQLLDDPPSS